MKYLIGIDLGTSSVKSLLLREDGQIVGVSQQAYDISIPSPGCAEQSPEEWWSKTCLSVKDLISKTGVSSKEIQGVGFSGQMHGLVILDQNYSPIRPCIIWADQRSKHQVSYINQRVGKERLGKLTLNPVATGFLAASLLWVKENQPEVYDSIYKVMLPKDYIRLKFTGQIGTDQTDASSSLLFDAANLRWCSELIEELGLVTTMLPECYLPTQIAGYVTKEAGIKTGLSEGTPVVFGCGDQPAQALGNGIISPGTISVTIGTGGQVFTPVNTPTYDPELRTHTFCHAVPNTWNVMGATLSAGLSLKWLKNNILSVNSYDELSSIAGQVTPGSEGLVFLPYLAGERTPHMDPLAKGMFFGLTLKHDRSSIARSVMEGVVFSLKDSIDIFKSLNLNMEKVIASGGGSKSKLWKQIMADVFECDVYTSSSIEQASMGAAILAGIGVGMFDSAQEACSRFIKIQEQVIKPDPKNLKAYIKNLKLYRQIYQITKELMKE